MARPQKQCVDYFPHDNDASSYGTVSILFNHFGHEGISFYWQLREIVSRTETHVIRLETPDSMEETAARLRFTPERMLEILAKMAYLNVIDPKLWEYKIIWWQELVDSVADVYKNRKQAVPIKPVVSGVETIVSGKETPVSTNENPQSKVKESKVEETKVSKEINLPEWIDKELWTEFLKIRSKIKAVNSHKALSSLITELKKLKNSGNDPNKVIEQSIRNSWKDVYQLNLKDRGRNYAGRGSRVATTYTNPDDIG